MKTVNKFIKFWNVVMLFIPFYILFAVFNPLKVAFINNTICSYLYVVSSFILNDMILLGALYIRGLFGS